MRPFRPVLSFSIGALLLAQTLASSSRALAATHYPIHIDVISFGGSSLMQGTRTTLTPTSGGRYASLQGVQAMRRAGSCKDFLTDFQKRPLEVMKRNGYISPAMYEELSKNLAADLDARQLLLVNLYSELPYEEARALFGGTIPESRKMLEWTDPKGRWVRIGRGSLFAVRGQLVMADADGAVTLKPTRVPWQLGKTLPAGLTRNLDRSKVKALVELGRAHSENGILPGDLRLAVRTLTATLEREFFVLGVPPGQVMMTGHFLDSQHARLFTGRFPMRPLTPRLQSEIEDRLEDTLGRIEEIPLPTGAEWKNHEDTVAVGSLQGFLDDFKMESLSESAFQLSRLSGGKLAGTKALHALTDFFNVFREDFDYELPGYGRSKSPIMVRDHGTTMPSIGIIKVFTDYGMPYGTPDFIATRDYIQVLPYNLEGDAFMAPWTDHCYFIRGDHPSRLRNDSVLDIANLDTQAALDRPITYLASVLLSVADLMATRIAKMPPELQPLMVEWTNDKRLAKGLPPVRALDAVVFLETFGLSMASSSPEVETQLRNLGGHPVVAVAYGLKLIQDRHVEFGINPARIYEFKLREIREIERLFPQLNVDARSRLHPAAHSYRLRMLQSAYE